MSDKRLILPNEAEAIRSELLLMLDSVGNHPLSKKIECLLDMFETFTFDTSDAMDILVKQQRDMVQLVAEVTVDFDDPYEAASGSKVRDLIEKIQSDRDEVLSDGIIDALTANLVSIGWLDDIGSARDLANALIEPDLWTDSLKNLMDNPEKKRNVLAVLDRFVDGLSGMGGDV